MSGPAPTMWISWKSDQNCDLYRNFFYIYNHCGFVIRDLQNEKRDHPHPPPYEVEGVRIVIISFRNIAKNLFAGDRQKVEAIVKNALKISSAQLRVL